MTLPEIRVLHPDRIILSPGPGRPEDAGITMRAAADTLPDCLTVTARTEDGEVMAVQHREFPIFGVQFHPESILTPDGKTMLRNFMKRKAESP